MLSTSSFFAEMFRATSPAPPARPSYQMTKIKVTHHSASQFNDNLPQVLDVPTFHESEMDAALAYEKRGEGCLYSWKSEGRSNLLVAGVSTRVDFFCFVILPEWRGSYIEMADDEIENEGKSFDD